MLILLIAFSLILTLTFHTSCLKKEIGQNITSLPKLPPLDDDGQLVLVLDAILDVKERKLRSRIIKEYLIRWRDLPTKDATLEGEQILQHPNLQLLEDKQFQEGRSVMSPSKEYSEVTDYLFNSCGLTLGYKGIN